MGRRSLALCLALGLLALAAPRPAAAWSKRTCMCIAVGQYLPSETIRFEVSEVDSFDWDGECC